MANGMALVAQVAPRSKIGTYVGFLTSAFVAATVLGFTLGGVILQIADWPVLFLLNIPLGVIALVLAVFFIPRDSGKKVRFTALSFMGVPILPLALGLQSLVQDGPVLIYMVAFVAALAIVGGGILRSGNALAAVILAGYATVIPESGVRVLVWGFALFVVPMALALGGLSAGKREVD